MRIRAPRKTTGVLVLLFLLGAWWWMGVVGTSSADIFRGLTIEESQQEVVVESVSEIAKVRFVIDGDTFILSDGRKVRLIGIDTPERWQPYYSEAKRRMMELVFGKEVELVRDVRDVDKYGRLLRYVYVGDEFVNLKMMEEGYARVLTIPPDVKYSELFVDAERGAQKEKLGLWIGGL